MKQIKGRYHWVESGLDNVYIEGSDVMQWECPNGHKTVQIKSLANVLSFLADIIANKKKPLTGQEIRFLRKSIHWKSVDMARALGIEASSYSRIENGHSPVSPQVDRAVRMIYENPVEAERKLLGISEGIIATEEEVYTMPSGTVLALA